MAFDPSLGGVTLFGGIGRGEYTAWTDTWNWDGSTWSQRALVGPTARLACAIACDQARQRVVVHGGSSPGGLVLGDTWEWDGVAWRQVPVAPLRRSDAAMVNDTVRGNVVLFGGADGGMVWPADTWTWDGRQWTRRAAAVAPGSRHGHAVVYEDARQQLVMFGGVRQSHFSGPAYLDDTWVWEQTHWRLLVPSVRPPARGWHAMAHDARRARLVMFGGFGVVVTFGDTWEWDGANWRQIAPAVGPPARQRHAMAYDHARQRTVLFGGFGVGNGVLGDTWEWDGTTWTQLASTGPGIGTGGMAFDRHRQRLVLFGGGGFGSAPVTWEWDGTNWRQQPLADQPLGRFSTAMAYDHVARRVLMFGGAGLHPLLPITAYFGDTWLYGDLMAPNAARIGSPCAGTNGPPLLVSDGPYLGAPAFALDLLGARPATPCAFGVAIGTQSLPIGGGCTLYLLPPIATLLAVTNPHGFASGRFAVPVDPILRGAAFHAQAFVADPLGAAGGLAVTAGRRLVCGD